MEVLCGGLDLLHPVRSLPRFIKHRLTADAALVGVPAVLRALGLTAVPAGLLAGAIGTALLEVQHRRAACAQAAKVEVIAKAATCLIYKG